MTGTPSLGRIHGRPCHERIHRSVVLVCAVTAAICGNDWMQPDQRAVNSTHTRLGAVIQPPGHFLSYRQAVSLATGNSGRRPASWSVQRIYNPPEGSAFADGVQFPRLPLFLAASNSVSRAQAEAKGPVPAGSRFDPDSRRGKATRFSWSGRCPTSWLVCILVYCHFGGQGAFLPCRFFPMPDQVLHPIPDVPGLSEFPSDAQRPFFRD